MTPPLDPDFISPTGARVYPRPAVFAGKLTLPRLWPPNPQPIPCRVLRIKPSTRAARWN